MRLLLIEDDCALCEALRPALEGAGYRVDACHDGADALPLLASGAYELCILDRMLPGLDGLRLLRAARAQGVDTPVLMLTALSGVGERVDGLDAGADDYLAKPFDTRELLARMRALARRPATAAPAVLRCGDVELTPAELTLTGPAAATDLQTRPALLAQGWGRWPRWRTPTWTVTSILCAAA